MKAENGIAQFNVPFINGINQLEAEGVSQIICHVIVSISVCVNYYFLLLL